MIDLYIYLSNVRIIIGHTFFLTWHHQNTSFSQNWFFLEAASLFNTTSTDKHWDLQVPAVQWQPLRLFIHMFTYYHKYPTGHSAQRDYSGLNLWWHRNEQGSQQLRWLKLASLDGTHSTNKKTNCMPLGPIMNWWHHLSLMAFVRHYPDRVIITQANCHAWQLGKSSEQVQDTFYVSYAY